MSFWRLLNSPAVLAALSPPDRQFLRQVAGLIQARLADARFDVTQLSKALELSRTQVHRKLKTLTGDTPGKCIRVTRLYRALALLRARAGTVAIISSQVGYGSPAHFTTAFARQFGFLPSVAHKQAKPD